MKPQLSPVTAEAWAAFSLHRGIAPTSIRWLQGDTLHWIEQEAKAGVEWTLTRIEIRKVEPDDHS
jgi:hypothetical protein